MRVFLSSHANLRYLSHLRFYQFSTYSMPVFLCVVAKEKLAKCTWPIYAFVSTVSERLPVRGVYQQLAAVRTHLHSDESSVYLSYKDVPWWLGVRKEVFSPNETLSNPKTIDLVFYQIVRDVFQYPSVRIPPNGRDEVKKVLGKITMNNTMVSNNMLPMVMRLLLKPACLSQL